MRTCEMCSQQLADNVIWCGACGRKVAYGVYPDTAQNLQTNKKLSDRFDDDVQTKASSTSVLTKAEKTQEKSKVDSILTEESKFSYEKTCDQQKSPSVDLNILKEDSLFKVPVLMSCNACNSLVVSLNGKCKKCGAICGPNTKKFGFFRVFNVAEKKGLYKFYINGINVSNLKPLGYVVMMTSAKKIKIDVVSEHGRATVYTALQIGEMRHILISDKSTFTKYELKVQDISSDEMDNIFSRYDNTQSVIMKDKYKEPYHYYPPCVDGLN